MTLAMEPFITRAVSTGDVAELKRLKQRSVESEAHCRDRGMGAFAVGDRQNIEAIDAALAALEVS